MPSVILKKKDLYLGKCLGDLSKLSEVKLNTDNVIIIIRSLNKVFEDANNCEKTGDEEKAYVLYLKYFSILKVIKTKADYKKQKDYYDKIIGTKNQIIAIEKAEKLSESLKERYDFKEAEALAKKLPENEIKEEATVIVKEKEREAPNPEDKTASTPGQITSLKLCELLRDSSTKVIIMDVRSDKDYNQSHVSFTECINVPEEILLPGSTVTHIQSKLPQDSKALWSQRVYADYIILLDWKSTLNDVSVGTPLKTLKDALYKFDPSTLIKSEPLILQGGYEQWLIFYPTMTTNAHVLKPSDAAPLNPPSPTLTLDFDYPDLGASLQQKISNNANLSQTSAQSEDNSSTPLSTPNIDHHTLSQPTDNSFTPAPKFDRSLKPPSLKDNFDLSVNDRTDLNNFTSGQQVNLNNVLKNVDSSGMVDSSGSVKNINISKDNFTNGPKAINLSFKNNLVSDFSASVENRQEKESDLKNWQQTRAMILTEHQLKLKELEKKLLDLDKIKRKEEKDVADLMRMKKKLKEDLEEEKHKQDTELKKLDKEEKIKVIALDVAMKEEQEKKRRLEEVEKLRQDRKKDEKLKELEMRLQEEQEKKQLAEEALRLKLEEEEEQKFEKLMQEIKTKELEQSKESQRKEIEEMNSSQQKQKLMQEMKTKEFEQLKEAQRKEIEEMNSSQQKQKEAEELKRIQKEAERRKIEEKKARENESLEKKQLQIQKERENAKEKLQREKEQAQKIQAEREAATKKMEAEKERLLKESREKQNSGIKATETPASKTIPTSNLPVGWEKKLDRTTNRYYYIDHNHGKTQWAPPASVDTKSIVKLKDEPSIPSSRGLSRSYSSPNIKKQLDEEETLIKALPVINRNSKPSSEPLKPMPPRTAYSVRKRDLNPVYGNVGPALTGLRNLGNTCYMNSTIQCLNNTSPLIKYFLDGSYLYDINRESSQGMQGEVVDEFAVVVSALWSGEYRSITPRDLKTTIAKYNSMFAGYQQQDSQEFLTFLLDGLHEGLNEFRKAPEIPEQNNEQLTDSEAAHIAWTHHKLLHKSVIVELFQGQLKSTLMCRTCLKTSVTFQAFMFLSLPIPTSSKCSLMDCLREFLKPELMTGSSKWKCPRCMMDREAEKKIDIWKLPHILLIGLNRFYADGMWMQKKTTFVDFPVNDLDFSKYIIGPPPRHQYNLYAISNHYGTMEGGHYTAFCKNPVNKKWYKFDDQDVYEMSSSDVKSPAAFVLYYTSIDMPIPMYKPHL